MVEIDEDGRLDVRRFDFYVGICIHYDGKKTLTSVSGFREGVSYEWMLNFMKGFLRCRGNVVDHKVLGKIILLQGDWSKDVQNLLVNHHHAERDQVYVTELYNRIDMSG
ncbi:hypothetical protein LWI29_029243 [Acer saccharum]|uniref:SUI1 domain-containing protein n=1 Tax=Acer saccharum TaxID=4024 RepID=A0AA39W2Q1_ACESA|nr:hypothetical protein LWI29_029243 [Acer saccharum]